MKTIIITFALIFASNLVEARMGRQYQMRGGTEVGNGTFEFAPDHGAAWFLGKNKSIKACVRMAPDFGVDRSQAVADVQEAFKKWVTYIKDKRVYHHVPDRFAEFLPAMHLTMLDGECRGREDLQFLLGGNVPKVASPADLTIHPVALAKKTAYDPNLGWGQGIVWVKSTKYPVTSSSFPNWQRPHQLKMLLLHEFGHIFGNAHVTDTVMDERFSANVRNLYGESWHSAPESEAFRNDFAIDGMRELVLCKSCDMKAKAANINAIPEGFQVVAGYFPSSETVCSVEDYSANVPQFKVLCKTGLRTERWTLTVLSTEAMTDHRSLFKISKAGAGVFSIDDRTGEQGLGSLATEDGRSFNVRYWRNAGEFDSQQFKIQLLLKGKMMNLFESRWQAIP